MVSVSGIKSCYQSAVFLFGAMHALESLNVAMCACEYCVSLNQKIVIPYVFKVPSDKASYSCTHVLILNMAMV